MAIAGQPKTRLVDGVRTDIATGEAFSDTPTPTGTPSITSDSLTSEPEINIPPVPPSTEASALQGTIQAQTDQFTEGLKTEAETAKKGRDTSLSDLLKTFQEQQGETALTAQAEKEAGVDEVSAELKDINNQILQEQVGLQRQIEQIEKNIGGGTPRQLQGRIQEVTRNSIRKQADLSVIQMGIQGRFDSAKAIADRAVAVQLEGQKRELDLRSLIFQENKELFTTAESRLFESTLADRTRALNKEEADRTAIYNLAIEAKKNGASNAAMQSILNSKTPEQALSVGGNFLVKPTAASAPKLQNFGTSDSPNWRQYNYQTGEWEQVSGLENSGMSPQQVNEIDSGIQESQVSIDVINNLLDNDRGVGAITGQFKTPTVSGFLQGGKGDAGAVATFLRYTPIVGNVIGAVQSRNDRDSALTDLTYIYNTEGFSEFIGLKQSGLTFGSLTEGERRSIFAAANRLNSAVTAETQPGTDTSTITGYRGTDEELKRDLQLVAKGLKARQDELNAQLMLGQDDKQAIINTP